MNIEEYERIRNGSARGFRREERGIVEVSGAEAVQFLDGLITNDVKKLEDGAEMRAAFPNAKGRLLAVADVRRTGERFLFGTGSETRRKVYDYLFRFTYAGDFFVEDRSDQYAVYRFFGESADDAPEAPDGAYKLGGLLHVPSDLAGEYERELLEKGHVDIGDELYETLRIEEGIPRYGTDMDEETVVPETGLADMISYNKGCYIGQEVIARIHFRGRVAKELKGLVFEDPPNGSGTAAELAGAELLADDERNAGFLTSVTHSPKLGRTIALGYVRSAYAAEGTELKVGGLTAKVKDLPFL